MFSPEQTLQLVIRLGVVVDHPLAESLHIRVACLVNCELAQFNLRHPALRGFHRERSVAGVHHFLSAVVHVLIGSVLAIQHGTAEQQPGACSKCH
jgi:hypothetical protein